MESQPRGFCNDSSEFAPRRAFSERSSDDVITKSPRIRDAGVIRKPRELFARPLEWQVAAAV